jgi:hypothetical protein
MGVDRQAEILKNLDIPWLRRPVEAELDVLCADLDRRWLRFARELRQGKLKHLDYDPQHKTLKWRKPKAEQDEDVLQHSFYDRLSAQGIADVFHFVTSRWKRSSSARSKSICHGIVPARRRPGTPPGRTPVR